MNKALMSWSTGKDSAYALHQLKQLKNEFDVVGLFTTLTASFDRTSIHGVRRKLLEAQAKRMNLSLFILEIPYPCSNEGYESLMKDFLVTRVVSAHISHIAFGDLFLEDIRRYRETKLSSISIQPLFPLWQQKTKSLAHEMIDQGFKAIITCVDSKKINDSFVGRVFDKDFIQDLPSDIDPCGENGEFHSFIYDAPLFASPIPVLVGETVKRDGFVFADLLLNE